MVDLKTAALVLRKLEKRGLVKPSIASGFIRGWITGSKPTDIDVQYAGMISREQAQVILEEVLDVNGLDKTNWDIKGIWNTQIWSGVEPEKYYLLFFVDSIDSVYLGVDGKLHDPTGYGLLDAKAKILRMNDFTKTNFAYADDDIVYVCIRGCEKIAREGWFPTPKSEKLIAGETERWNKLPIERQKFLIKDYVLGKIKPEIFNYAREVYAKYGWGFLFDEARKDTP